jgi:hypothetical protein
MQIFEAAQLFNPCVASTLDYQRLLGYLTRNCPHIRALDLNSLLAEWPDYIQDATSVAAAMPDADIFSFGDISMPKGRFPNCVLRFACYCSIIPLVRLPSVCSAI